MGQGFVFDKRSYAIAVVVAIALFHLAPTPVEAACGSKGVTLVPLLQEGKDAIRALSRSLQNR
jgi:hypothetical protein